MGLGVVRPFSDLGNGGERASLGKEGRAIVSDRYLLSWEHLKNIQGKTWMGTHARGLELPRDDKAAGKDFGSLDLM